MIAFLFLVPPIDEAEDCAAGAYAKRQYENDNRAESRIAPKSAEREA